MNDPIGFSNLFSPSVWLAVAVVAGILELSVPSFTFSLVSLAALAASASAFYFAAQIQLLIFCVALLLTIFVLRPLLLRQGFHRLHHLPSRSGDLMNLTGEVTEAIDPITKHGRVFVKGEDWLARADDEIVVGRTVTVVDIDGITLIVKEVI